LGKKEFFEKLNNNYSQRFSETQTARIREITRHLTDQDFERLVNFLIDRSKFLPIPKDFNEAMVSLNIQAGRKKMNVTSCGRCINGWIHATKREKGCDMYDIDHKMFCTKEKCYYPNQTFKCNCQAGQVLSHEIKIFDFYKDSKIWKIRGER